MIIKIVGLSLLCLGMFAIGYFCGVVLTGTRFELEDRAYSNKVEAAHEMMCDHYCAVPYQALSEDDRDSRCAKCPLDELQRRCST